MFLHSLTLLDSFVQQVGHDLVEMIEMRKVAAFVLVSLGSLFGFVLGQYFTHRSYQRVEDEIRRQQEVRTANRQLSQQQEPNDSHEDAVDGQFKTEPKKSK
jgi:hypothetical protein